MLYAVAIAVSIVIIALLFMAYRNNKNKVRVFNSAEDLTAFLRKKYTSEIKHHQPIHGLVLENASIERTLEDSAMGNLGRSAVDIQVNLVTKDGYQEVSAPCGNVKAAFNQGDLVIVLPIHNERHGFWHYVTIAKLQPAYDGKTKNWVILENYLQG